MAAKLVKLTTITDILPGKAVIRWWNNAKPAEAVWYVQAVPLESSFTSFPPDEQSVEVEVTRVWRKLNWKKGPGEFPYEGATLEHEVWYEIKNIGTQKVDVDVYASIAKLGSDGLTTQYGGNIHIETDDTEDKSVTWKPQDGKPRNVLAEIALARQGVHDDDTLAIARIDKIVSTEAGTETNPTTIVRRNGVSEVVFTLLVNNGAASARWMVHEFA